MPKALLRSNWDGRLQSSKALPCQTARSTRTGSKIQSVARRTRRKDKPVPDYLMYDTPPRQPGAYIRKGPPGRMGRTAALIGKLYREAPARPWVNYRTGAHYPLWCCV